MVRNPFCVCESKLYFFIYYYTICESFSENPKCGLFFAVIKVFKLPSFELSSFYCKYVHNFFSGAGSTHQRVPSRLYRISNLEITITTFPLFQMIICLFFCFQVSNAFEPTLNSTATVRL